MLATYVVDNIGDSGPGTLRAAILEANASVGQDEIVFNIGSGGQQTIQPLAPLPEIVDPVAIQGASQPGFVDSPLIQLDGSLLVGANITATDTRLRGC